jgi:ribosomal protein S18 acetylase RimI-like enzyme
MQLSSAAPADACDIAKIHVRTWQAAYKGIVPARYLEKLSIGPREAMWSEAIFRGTPAVVVAKQQQVIVGFVAFGPCRDEGASTDQGEIWAIYVEPLHWSQGVGRQLWLGARERLSFHGYRTVSLWVLAHNARAINFYLAAGFRRESHISKEWTVAGTSLEEIRYFRALDA